MNELFLKIVNMSISASWLVLAVLLLRLVLKKAPKWINVLFWGIVAVRLICPFSFESALSLIPSAETIPLNIGMDTTPAINSGINAINNVVNPVISQSYTPMAGASVNPLQITISICEYIWIIGMIVLALYTAISYWCLHRKVDTAVFYKDNIFQSENVSSPFVLGIIKPKIYLSFKMDTTDLEHVVAHEQAHINRKDHWWKPLGFLLLTIHWFNPLMWLAYVLLCRDIELACDEKVIKELGNEQRADYTQALVACSVNRCMIAACPLAFGEVGVKERVKAVMNYKKPAFWVIILAVVACVGVAVCFLTNPKQDSYMLQIVVPAGSREEFVYSDEEVSTIKNSIKIWSGDGLGDTEVLLSPVNDATETGCAATYLTHDMPVEFDAEKDAWFKVGVNMQNPTNEDIIVYVEVENAEVRISDESTPDRIAFEAEILKIYDECFLVKPESGWALNSADQIEAPMRNMDPALEPQVGDMIEISCSGEILETYPARLSNVYSIKVVEEAESWDLIPMVMVNGTLYLDTGHESTIEARCGVMDGEITSQVAQSEPPTIDGQSNFGTGYGYQYGSMDGTIEIYMNNKWRIFATEEVRQKLQFPPTEADTWSFTDAASIQVINGNNGERITFAKDTAKHDFQKILDLCQNLEKTTDTEENSRVGYNYCIIMNDNYGQWLHSITPYKDGYTVDDTFYKYSDVDTNRYNNASVRLLDYLGLLFYPAEDVSEIIENPLAAITEFTKSVNTLEYVEMLMEKYKYTEGDMEIVNHSGKEL